MRLGVDRGTHLGQRPVGRAKQAGHTIAFAPDQIFSLKPLATTGPSTHGLRLLLPLPRALPPLLLPASQIFPQRLGLSGGDLSQRSLVLDIRQRKRLHGMVVLILRDDLFGELDIGPIRLLFRPG